MLECPICCWSHFGAFPCLMWLAHERLGEAGHRGERLPPRGARPPRPARSAAAPSRVAPRVLPSPEEGLSPVDGIAAVCRAALGGGYGRVGYTPSGKGLVEDGGAGGLKPSATLRASVADPAAFFTRRAPVAPPSAAVRRGARPHHRRPAGSPGGGWRPGAGRGGLPRRTGAACPPRTHGRRRTTDTPRAPP